MPDPQDRLTALEEQVAALRARLTALEDLAPSHVQQGAAEASPLVGAAILHSDHESHTPQTGTMQGTISYAGSIQIGEQPYRFR